jgi:DNA-binding response OmpR family regulator
LPVGLFDAGPGRARDLATLAPPAARSTELAVKACMLGLQTDRVTSPTPTHPAQILLVDDERLVLRCLSAALRRNGFEVTTARDGVEALQALASAPSPPDLILTDFHMPNLDGAGLIDALRRNARTRDIPIILQSGSKDALLEVAGRQNAADIYLAKPVMIDEIVDRMRQLLRAQPAAPPRPGKLACGTGEFAPARGSR